MVAVGPPLAVVSGPRFKATVLVTVGAPLTVPPVLPMSAVTRLEALTLKGKSLRSLSSSWPNLDDNSGGTDMNRRSGLSPADSSFNLARTEYHAN